MTPRRIMLSQISANDDVCLSIVSGEPAKARAARFWLTPEQAAHVGHRLMAFAASGHNGIEKVAEENAS